MYGFVDYTATRRTVSAAVMGRLISNSDSRSVPAHLNAHLVLVFDSASA